MILITGGAGLIGSAISRHLWGYEPDGVYSYDYTGQGNHWINAADQLEITRTVSVFIDCARYANAEDQRRVWDTVIEQMKHSGGKMVLFSSIYGHKVPHFDMYPGTEIPTTPLVYAMWKAGVEQATRYLAEQLKPYSIQVNCIAPGGVYNNHSREFQDAYQDAGGEGMIEPKNILPVVDMLLHPDNKVNGQVITIDGGWR